MILRPVAESRWKHRTTIAIDRPFGVPPSRSHHGISSLLCHEAKQPTVRRCYLLLHAMTKNWQPPDSFRMKPIVTRGFSGKASADVVLRFCYD